MALLELPHRSLRGRRVRGFTALLAAGALALAGAGTAVAGPIGVPAADPGTIAAWGLDNFGQATAPTGSNFTAISAGEYHSLALTEDGTIETWGSNTSGQATAPTGSNFTAISAGESYSVALTENGTIETWGSNGDGLGTTPPGNGYTAIAAGWHHSLALKSYVAPAFTDTAPVTLDGVAGTALTRTFTVTGYPAPAISVVDPATVPTGMTFTDGVLAGTPTAAGTYTFVLNASNDVDPDATLTVTVKVTDTPVIPEVPETPGTGGSLENLFGFGS